MLEPFDGHGSTAAPMADVTGGRQLLVFESVSCESLSSGENADLVQTRQLLKRVAVCTPPNCSRPALTVPTICSDSNLLKFWKPSPMRAPPTSMAVSSLPERHSREHHRGEPSPGLWRQRPRSVDPTYHSQTRPHQVQLPAYIQ
uniref:Uncharacterized protein n=1 Tax=Mesocestoides corti TaxID=53468 RepID=A0A5K3FTW5_MESCO